MPLDPLPSLDRTSATFKTDLDTLFLTKLPAFSVQAESLRSEVNGKEASAVSAASMATTQAGNAATSAGAAAGSASAAATQAGISTTKAGEAATSAGAAAGSASEAATQAGSAITKAGEAGASADAAALSAASIAAGPVASVRGMVGVVVSDTSGGIPGLTLFKLNLKNALGTFTNFFTSATTASRTWVMPDKDGTVAMVSDITGTNSGTNTGDQTSIVGITGTTAQFNTALTDGDFATLAGAEILSSKTFVAPALGTPASANLANCTVDGTNKVGFRGIPLVPASANTTVTKSHAGGGLKHPSADTTARTFTTDSNANQSWIDGTAITYLNQNGAGVVTIAVTTDTMRLIGAGTTGNRTLGANGIATKIWDTATATWYISGTVLT